MKIDFFLNYVDQVSMEQTMGNTHSSFGLFFGSIVGGIIMGPFTGGASIVAAMSVGGAAVGATTAVINGAVNRHGLAET